MQSRRASILGNCLPQTLERHDGSWLPVLYHAQNLALLLHLQVEPVVLARHRIPQQAEVPAEHRFLCWAAALPSC
jgi:hypothetical protein